MLWICLCSRNIRDMKIKKQIILDDKDYERLVHDANLSNDEIKSKIASALTTDIVVSFDFDVNKKVTGNMRIESATHNLGYNEYDNIVRARDENIHHAVYTAIYDYLEKIKRDNNELSAKDWILFTSIILYIFAMGFAGGWLVFNRLNHGLFKSHTRYNRSYVRSYIQYT